MGFDYNGARLLIASRKQKVNFKKTLCIGRQGLHLKNHQLQKLLEKAGLDAKKINAENSEYSEWFLKTLGAEKADAMDASDYEGANCIHDLNLAIPDQYKSAYSLVIDGGSLEHIFNFPQALKNCMEMIQVGGHFISITPCNNFLGHGFYQFSPELYYNVFQEENGFEMIKMYFYTQAAQGEYYEVVNPKLARERVTLVNTEPSYLFVIAKKIAEKNLFSKYPQQSDYKNILWQNEEIESKKSSNSIFELVKKVIPSITKNKLIHTILKHRDRGISNPRFFKKTKKE